MTRIGFNLQPAVDLSASRGCVELLKLRDPIDALVGGIQRWRAREIARTQVARMSSRDAADIGTTRQQLEFQLDHPVSDCP